jgi:hypothetical protein
MLIQHVRSSNSRSSALPLSSYGHGQPLLKQLDDRSGYNFIFCTLYLAIHCISVQFSSSSRAKSRSHPSTPALSGNFPMIVIILNF